MPLTRRQLFKRITASASSNTSATCAGICMNDNNADRKNKNKEEEENQLNKYIKFGLFLVKTTRHGVSNVHCRFRKK